jgi:hypothetical protein
MSSSSDKKVKMATVCAAFLASVLGTSVSYAGPGDSKLMLSVFEDTPGAREVLSGRYESAIKLLKNRTVAYQGDYARTNLCVAYIMARQAEAAKGACDEAIDSAKAGMPRNIRIARATDKALLALAYSNRAVLSWLRKHSADAEQDVTRAHELAPDAQFVAANWAVYKSGRGVEENTTIALNRR